MDRGKSNTIVIGAGIAGIKASQDLTRAGISNLVLEARDRLGGRLHTVKLNSGTPIDLGASWFHDCYDNPLLEKYWKSGKVNFYFDDGKTTFYSEDGKVDENEKLRPILEEIKLYLADTYDSLTVDQDVSVKETVYNYIKEKRYLLTDYQIRMMPQIARYFEMWIGSSWEVLSSRNISADVHKGRDAMVTNGYINVFDGELEELIAVSEHSTLDQLTDPNSMAHTKTGGISVKLNRVVYKIEFVSKKKEIRVHTKDSVTGNNVQVFTCEYLIVTVPLSILKLSDLRETGAIEWSPPLPKPFTKSLEKVSFSNLGKVFFEFPQIFWSVEEDRIFSLPKADETYYKACKNDPMGVSSYKFEIKTKDTPIPVGTIPNGLDYYVLLLNIARPTGKPLLLILTSAPLTQFLEEQEDENVIFQVFKPVFARISGLKESEVPQPLQIKTSKWSADPYARGSYTGVTVGDDYEAALENLMNPKAIFDGTGRVRFAGEGTTDDGNGCAHAAWTTGGREAAVIIKKNNKSKL